MDPLLQFKAHMRHLSSGWLGAPRDGRGIKSMIEKRQLKVALKLCVISRAEKY